VTAPPRFTRWGPSPDRGRARRCRDLIPFDRLRTLRALGRLKTHGAGGDTQDVVREANARTRPYERAVVLGGIVAFVVLAAVMWHSARPTRWEKPLIRTVDRLPIPIRGFWISAFQPVWFALIAIALAAIVAFAGRRRLAASGLAGCLGAVMAAELIFKPLVDRVRTHEVGRHHRIIQVGSEMFPSAHVTAAAALATFVWLVLDRRLGLALLLVALPFVVSCATIALQLHYPADVIGGVLLGTTFVWCTVAAANHFAPPAPTDRERAYDPVGTSR
jgi:membrane-associated phospholipid phosphatase